MSYNCTGITNTCNSLIDYCKKKYYNDICSCIINKDFYDTYCVTTTNIMSLIIMLIGGLFVLGFIFLCYTKICIIYKRNNQQNIQRNQIQNNNNNTIIDFQPNHYYVNTDLPKYEDISRYPNSEESPPAYETR